MTKNKRLDGMPRNSHCASWLTGSPELNPQYVKPHRPVGNNSSSYDRYPAPRVEKAGDLFRSAAEIYKRS